MILVYASQASHWWHKCHPGAFCHADGAVWDHETLRPDDLPQFNRKLQILKLEAIRPGDMNMVMQTGGYDRTILYRSPDGVDGPQGIEIVRFEWPPGSRTPNHDHSAPGTVIVLEGTIYEKKAGKTAHVTAGNLLVEVELGIPHIVGNDGAEPAVSVHTYFTRQLRMNEYPDPPGEEGGSPV